MRIFGLEISRSKALSPVSGALGRLWTTILEPFTGAWQRNEALTRDTLLTYPTLYACIHRIVTDIGKLPFKLMEKNENGLWIGRDKHRTLMPVLHKPNRYQTGQQFREAWLLSKLTQGNTYALKVRNGFGRVTELHILDPFRTIPMISDSGEVFYEFRLNTPDLVPAAGYGNGTGVVIIPAREIIHDRCMTLHHPLIGVPPVCAAHWPAVKNLRILKDSSTFFENGAQPGGILTAPAGMSDEDAKAVKEYWNTNFTGENRGRVAVIGADMKFTPFAFKAADSQLVEQMRYSDEQICQPFGIPPFKIGIGSLPAGMKVDDINQLYYADALQSHIESMEYLLDEGLEVAMPLGIELDLEPLLRMDEGKKAEVATKLVGGGIETPNEGRARFNRLPLEGGDTVYMQQQDYPLDQVRLNKIEQADSPAPAAAPEPLPTPELDEQARAANIALVLMHARNRLNQRKVANA